MVGRRLLVSRRLVLLVVGQRLVLLQGGGWIMNGYNLATMRWCGILNRIGFAYFFAGCIELWVQTSPPSSHVPVTSTYLIQW